MSWYDPRADRSRIDQLEREVSLLAAAVLALAELAEEQGVRLGCKFDLLELATRRGLSDEQPRREPPSLT